MIANNMLYFLNRNNIFFKNKSNIENFWQLVWHMIQVRCASWGIIPVCTIIVIWSILLHGTDSAGRFKNTAVIFIIVSVLVTIIIIIMIDIFMVRLALVSGALCLDGCALPNISKCAFPNWCTLPNLWCAFCLSCAPCLTTLCILPKCALPIGALCLQTHKSLWNGLNFSDYIVSVLRLIMVLVWINFHVIWIFMGS